MSRTERHDATFEADVRSADACARLVADAVDRFGSAGGSLVKNALVNLRADFVSTSEDERLRVFDTYLNETIRMCTAARAELVKSG